MSLRQTITDVATIIAVLFCAFWLLFSITGCTVSAAKDGEIGFRFGTDIALYSNAPDDGSEVSIDAKNWVQELVQSFDSDANAPATPE